MSIRIPCIVLLALSLPAIALAQDAARSQLDRFADGLETLSGQFAQTTLDADGFVSEASSGDLFFLSPDRFRWRYVEPFPQELVADGTHLWHYDESLEQVTQQDQPTASESPLLVLTQPELLDRFYSISATGDQDVIEFRPLDTEAEFEVARLYFADQRPIALEFDDTFGQRTRIDLIDLVRNPTLSTDLFVFELPEGADVLQGY